MDAAVGYEITTPLNCEAWDLGIYATLFPGIGLASALLTLRTIAIWNKNKIVIGLAVLIWIIHISFLIYGITQGGAQWNIESNGCVELNTHTNSKILLVTLCTDLGLLTIMLFRVWHQRKSGDLWNLLYRQGVLWVAGATAGELPTIILTWINLNYIMNSILVPFALLATTFCATRMYRDLCEYATPMTRTEYLSVDISPMKPKSANHNVILKPQLRTLIVGQLDERSGTDVGNFTV
ncbi:hypothetical protein Clacol_001237 [Clathrus columnatus]|uniref:Uncharacterized protein n=1 Tax=Clathrus columnatus TaxID=1419009 RepID=A0AAV5A172_9AGAM|nr:hypothetical protein Clacol_001237 [Clathrus columnatus]